MAITITPFTVDPTRNSRPPLIKSINEEKTENNDPMITYWGIYLDDKQVSFVSSEELAERTKLWMEKWLSEKN